MAYSGGEGSSPGETGKGVHQPAATADGPLGLSDAHVEPSLQNRPTWARKCGYRLPVVSAGASGTEAGIDSLPCWGEMGSRPGSAVPVLGTGHRRGQAYGGLW